MRFAELSDDQWILSNRTFPHSRSLGESGPMIEEQLTAFFMFDYRDAVCMNKPLNVMTISIRWFQLMQKVGTAKASP